MRLLQADLHGAREAPRRLPGPVRRVLRPAPLPPTAHHRRRQQQMRAPRSVSRCASTQFENVGRIRRIFQRTYSDYCALQFFPKYNIQSKIANTNVNVALICFQDSVTTRALCCHLVVRDELITISLLIVIYHLFKK